MAEALPRRTLLAGGAAMLALGAVLLALRARDLAEPRAAGALAGALLLVGVLLAAVRRPRRTRRELPAAPARPRAARPPLLRAALALAALALAWVAVLRPWAEARTGYLRLLDYGAALLLASAALAWVLARARRDAPILPMTSDARRHERRVRALPDAAYRDLDAAVRAFVDRGDVAPYERAVLQLLERTRAPPALAQDARALLAAPAPRARGLRAQAEARAHRLARHRSILALLDVLPDPEVKLHA